MVKCLRCAPEGTSVQKITGFNVNPQVRSGDTYELIIYHTKRRIIGSTYSRISIWDGAKLIMESGSIRCHYHQETITKFKGIMPNHNLILRASLQIEGLGFLEECEDGVDIFIKLAPSGSMTMPTKPDDKYIPESSVNDNDDDNGDDSISDWIMDNLIIVLVLLILMILLLKFG